MLRKDGLDVWVMPTVSGNPIIRRDTNTVIFSLTREEALTLIGDITKAFGDGSFDRVTIGLEADHIYAKDME